MSSEPFVRASGLSKRYVLHDRPLDRLTCLLLGRDKGRVHWAVRGVDLSLSRGDCLGVVGRNGAGKSTLLELVCGILSASEGRVDIEGRLAALLQLGAGFNPEFTGRENVLLAGTIYGLRPAEVARRMPAIEEFAGIGSFIDRPVREYSSGMYARLAFSVCAHVDADILVVDEILGVGDVRFQQRSMRFLRDFRRRGIVLFVSHNEHAVAALCNKAIWIDGGRVVASGEARTVLTEYRRGLSRAVVPGTGFAVSGDRSFSAVAVRQQREEVAAFDPDYPPPPDLAGRIVHADLDLGSGPGAESCRGGETVRLRVACETARPLVGVHVLFLLRNPLGQIVLSGDSRDLAEGGAVHGGAGCRFDCRFEFRLPFLPTGTYPVELFLLSEAGDAIRTHDHEEFQLVLRVLSRHISSGMANLPMEDVRLSVDPAGAAR